MKNTTMIASWIAIGWLLIATSFAVFAGSWQQNPLRGAAGQGMNRQIQTAVPAKPAATAKTRGPASSTHSGALMSIAPSALSEQEKADLAFQYREEMVARDMYAYFHTLYQDPEFKTIADSEQQHMDSVKTLLDRYSLPLPTGYGELQTTFDALKAEWQKGLKEALEVGLKIEMLDIKDIADTIKTTDNADLKLVFSNIGGASYNHLRSFARQIGAKGFTTSIDYSAYLTAAEVASKGSLKGKLADRLAKDGIAVPASPSSGSGSCQSGKTGGQMHQGKCGNMTNGACGKSSGGTCKHAGKGSCGMRMQGNPAK